MRDTDELIDQLTGDLQPRARISPWSGRALLALIAFLTVSLLVACFGMRPDFAAGHPHATALICALVMLSLCVTFAAGVTAMARPAVGATRSGWQWALAPIAILPIAAAVTAASDAAEFARMLPPEGPQCLIVGTLASLASIALLTFWLRRGAPTSAARAAWLIGIAGGAVGALAMAFVCPIDAITHIGTWHVGIVLMAAIGSRLALPYFLRW
jgi:hypothetical protein